jgi:hypothetical protein
MTGMDHGVVVRTEQTQPPNTDDYPTYGWKRNGFDYATCHSERLRPTPA